MSFLFPAMLAGFAALAVPTIIHLIARHKYPVLNFPSLRLLRYERRDNAFANRLVDPLQLLLRLLVLALLVLAMSRLFSPGSSSTPAPRNLVVVVDTSASMRIQARGTDAADQAAPIDRARRIAKALLSEIALPSRCALISAGDEVETLTSLGPDPAPAIAILDELNAGGGSGPGLVHAVSRAAELVRGRKEVKSQVVILTDRFAGAFESRNRSDVDALRELQDAMGDQLELVIVDLAGDDTDNIGITGSEVRGRTVRMGDDAHVVTTFRNFGTTNGSARLALTVGGRKSDTFREIELGPEEEVTVDLTAPVKRSLRGFATVSIDSKDALEHDNVYTLPFVVEASRRILIVNGVSDIDEPAVEDAALAGLGSGGAAIIEDQEVIDGTRILQYVLNPGRELGLAFGTGLNTEQITPEVLPAQTLSKYETIILYDVSSLIEQSLRDLDTFVREGRSVLIICSGSMNPVEFNASLAVPGRDRLALSPVRIGNDLTVKPSVPIETRMVAQDTFGETVEYDPGLWTAPFHDRREGDLSTIRFGRIREAVGIEDGATVLLQGGGHALAVEAKRGEGRVVTLMFGVELSRGNIAMTKVFPLLTWRLMDYLGRRLHARPTDVLTAATPSALDASDQAFRFVNELELAPALEQGRSSGATNSTGAAVEKSPIPLSANENHMVYMPGADVGNYWLRKARVTGLDAVSGYARPIVVNHDSRESRMELIEEAELQELVGPAVRIIKPADVASLVPMGLEWWRWAVILLVAAYFIEAIAGYVTGAVRDKRQEQLEESDESLEPQTDQDPAVT